jgi:hypothetical protein
VPNADFFLKTVPLLDGGQDVGMVLSPQVRERGCRGGMNVSWLAAGTTNSSCLSTPASAPPLQTFYNLNAEGDIFNHANVHFWDYTQPGYDALGLISCTGTNFLLRAKAFQQVWRVLACLPACLPGFMGCLLASPTPACHLASRLRPLPASLLLCRPAGSPSGP